jgi:hypothetical protein
VTTDAALAFETFHERVVGERLATPAGRAAVDDVAGAPSLAFRLPDGRAYRWTPTGDTIRIEKRDDAATVALLDERAWSDFATEAATAAGLRFAGRLHFHRGDAVGLERWEPALRAVLSGRPIFDPARATFVDRQGAPLDLHGSYDLSTRDADLRHFIGQTGYLHLRRVFSRDEIARLTALVEARQAAARPGDGRSWWGKRQDGTQVLCRLIYLGLDVPEIAALGNDPRLVRLGALTGGGLRHLVDRSDAHSVVIKNPGVVEGLSDLPWHRDCGLGGHPFTCPSISIGIQLDAASAASGRLHFVPGSWRGSWHRSDLARATTVAVDTEPGDCTVHLGDVLHAAPPPIGDGPGRRALYTTFVPPQLFDVIPPGQSYNDVILTHVGR